MRTIEKWIKIKPELKDYFDKVNLTRDKVVRFEKWFKAVVEARRLGIIAQQKQKK